MTTLAGIERSAHRYWTCWLPTGRDGACPKRRLRSSQGPRPLAGQNTIDRKIASQMPIARSSERSRLLGSLPAPSGAIVKSP